jgi:hypothetical protein
MPTLFSLLRRKFLHAVRRAFGTRVLRCAVATLVLTWCGMTFAAPNKPPTVSISTPSNGATFNAPANITISANATDADGTIMRVEFYQGSTLIGKATAAPFQVMWSNVAGGTYSLTAIAIDNAGGSKTSSAVSITVNGPKVLVTNPAAGSVIYGSSVTVTGSFFGDSNTTVVVDNGSSSRVATLSGNSFTATLPIQVGVNALRVAATRRDKTFDQAVVNVTGNAAPVLVFTMPATTTFNAPADINFTVDAVSPAGTVAKVEFLRGNTVVATSTASPYQYTWLGAASGTYTMAARAIDNSGVMSTITLPIVVNGPNAPPSVVLTSPGNNASFVAPANISLAANASDADGSITRVEFLQNGNVIGSSNIAPYSMLWSSVQAGSYALTARATDNRSTTSTSAAVNVVVTAAPPPNTPPTVSLVTPAAGTQYFAPAKITLQASASDADGAVAKVEFYQATTLLGTVTAPPYSFDWMNVGPGSYSVSAKATDNRGAVSTSSSVPVTVVTKPNTPPSITLTAPATGRIYYAPATIVLTATASDSDGSIGRVDFYQGGTLIGTSTTAPFSFTWNNVVAGDYTMTARAVDDAGATTVSNSASISVRALSINVMSPTDGATVIGDVTTVSGRIVAPTNSGVSVNGVIAALEPNGTFYATGVRLDPGANTIVARVTTPDGEFRTHSVAVTSGGLPPFKITAGPTQGLAPLLVTFSIVPQGSATIQRVEFDGNSDGTVEYSLSGAPWSTTLTFTGSGTSLTTIRVLDTDGSAYTTQIPIVLYTESALDQASRATWSGLMTALSSGDVARASQYLGFTARERYAAAFQTLAPYLSQIVSTFSDLHFVSLSGDLGEYAINRTINGENRIFFLYFGRDGDGVWRLQSM